MGLLLRAVDVAGPLRWRWLLADEQTGAPLADHRVDLDPASDEVVRFRDLHGYARWHAAPDQRTADESRIVTQAGAWAGHELLGETIGAAIVKATPVTVRVSVPPEAAPVLLWPLELAHARGQALAARGDVTLVYDLAPVPGGAKAAVSGALRVLAVFSQPTQTSVLALRRERYALGRLIRRIGARHRASVELKVVQYGVTRERLAQIADSGDGWDVLHLSGHGGRGLFLLEHADGSPDPVDTAGLVELLRPARRRVKLAVLSACQSAADVTAEVMRLIGLEDQAKELEEGDAAETARSAAMGPESALAVMGVARALVAELDCAVVAMRYPVADDFAIAFGDEFYERLLSRGQPVDMAAARALAGAAGGPPSAARPPVSLATPGVFGTRAAGLVVTAPLGAPELDPAKQMMAHFPDEPERFVGRARAMAEASTALASASGRIAVLLHGMAGAGKTACALELAYRHQDSFAAAAFWQAPTRDDEFAGTLARLAEALEIQLGRYGFTMTGHIGTDAALEAFLPRLRRVLEDNGVLLVLDNLETLLTPEGTWRDPRWASLIGTLCDHRGESRLIMTSRIPPAGLGSGVLVQPVHALSLDEAVALARELPNLRTLLHADPGPVRTEADTAADRERVRRILRVVQGHPKLLELADAAAADRTMLDAQLATAETATAGQGLGAFFRDGTSTLDPDQFLATLTTWTTAALAVLPTSARLLAEFLACLEDADRNSAIIKATWAGLWRRLKRRGDPPDPNPLLKALTTAALIQPESLPAASRSTQPTADHAAQSPVMYRMHPGVAAAIHAAADPATWEAVDTELAISWRAVAYQARQQEGGEDSGLIAHAGLAAAPYLLRRRDWNTAADLLEDTIMRDSSPGVIQAALPALRHIVAATRTPVCSFVLARALSTVDPAEAEPLLRDALRAAAGVGDYRLASSIAGELVAVLVDTGRLGEALDLNRQTAEYTHQAGLGPWTQLADHGRRLQILAQMGEHQQVLAETGKMQTRMRQLPTRPAGNETFSPWYVRETTILGASHASALALEQWQQGLDLNAEILTSRRLRGADPHEIARTRFNDAWPLIRLGQLAEAGQLLRACQQVFEDHRDTAMLAMVLGARADLEDVLGHPESAEGFAQSALRLGYARPDPRAIATCHHNLARYLRKAGGDPAGQRAHQLASALICQLTGMTHDLARSQRALATELHKGPGAVVGRLPATLAETIQVAEQTDGVRLGKLITALQPDARAAEEALAQILRTAVDPPRDDDADIAESVRQWKPVIAAIGAASQGNQDAAAWLTPHLDDLARNPDWAALIGVLRRILGGERGEDLLDGLDPNDTAVIRETLTRLAAHDQEPPEH